MTSNRRRYFTQAELNKLITAARKGRYKLGPEYSKMAGGLEEVDLTSSEGKELMSILLELDKLCTR